MRRLVRRFKAQFIQRSTQYLHAFQNHLDDMLIAVVLGATFDIMIQQENIQGLFAIYSLDISVYERVVVRDHQPGEFFLLGLL